MALLAAALAFFILHLLPATPLRPRLVSAVGEGLYTVLFSVVSVAALYWLIVTFEHTEYGDKFWMVPAAWYWLKLVIIYFAFVLALGGILTPNPSAPQAGKALNNPHLAEGIFAITRHPLMWSIAIWAIAHMISQANVRAFTFFGALALTALIGSWLQQIRKREVYGAAWDAFASKTSFVPFAALASGRTHLRLRSLALPALLALVLLGAVLHFHAALFGANPLPI